MPNHAADPVEGVMRELGGLSMELAHFEAALGCAIAFLANANEPKIGLILTAELSLKSRLALFSTLYIERLPQHKADGALRTFRADVHAVEGARNTLIHSVYWRGALGDRHVIRIKPTAKEKPGFRLQLEQVSELTVARQTLALQQLVERLEDQLMEAKFPEYLSHRAKFYALLSY